MMIKTKKVVKRPEKVENAAELRAYMEANLSSKDYAMFLRLVTLMKAGHISDSSFVKKLQYLLRDKPEALSILNRFFPDNMKIMPKKPRSYNHMQLKLSKSIELVNTMKKLFRDDETRLQRFLDVMEAYRSEGKTKEQTYEEAYNIFEGDDDVMKMVGSVFGLSVGNYVYLPENAREPIREFDPVHEAAINREFYAGAVMPPFIEFKLSDVLNNSMRQADNASIRRRERLGYGLFISGDLV